MNRSGVNETILAIALSVLRPMMEKAAEEELDVKKLLEKAYRYTLEHEEACFFMVPCGVEDGLRFTVGNLAVLEQLKKKDPEAAERLTLEIRVLASISIAISTKVAVDLSTIVDEFGDNEPFGVRGIYRDVKDAWIFETEKKPIIERGEKELEQAREKG